MALARQEGSLDWSLLLSAARRPAALFLYYREERNLVVAGVGVDVFADIAHLVWPGYESVLRMLELGHRLITFQYLGNAQRHAAY